MGKQFHYVWEWPLAATPSALWPYASDTNRFNRDAGVPFVEESAGVTPGTRRLRLRKFGVLVEWDEEPFEWVRPRSFGVLRRYASGPVAEMRVFTQIVPDGDSSSIMRYEVTATSRYAMGLVAIPLEIGWKSARRFRALMEHYAAAAKDRSSEPVAPMQSHMQLRPSPAASPPGGRERLDRARAVLGARFDANVVDMLIDAITRGEDLDVIRIRPYALADSWNVRRRTVVDLCLHATRAGLLDLQWDVLCPLCRGAKQTNESLSGISQPVHCDGCNIDFYANFEQQVELTFRPNSAIRTVDVFPFCVGGPQLTPHIIMQQMVPAGGSRIESIDLEAGRYRIRTLGDTGADLFEVDTNESTTVELKNETAERKLMVLERMVWSDQALTAAEVIAMQEFRDLFSSEALRPGEAINVGNMTILFTDLLGSTRMYRQIGDAPAFGRVLDHFNVLREAMNEEGGALVKTIGDSVMAVFKRPAGAIRAVLRAQKLLASLPEGVRPPNLKAGVHFGPCIAVTLNDRLDYFGSTVNIAARLDGLSAGGEIVISEAVADDPEVQSLLLERDISIALFDAQLKGYEDAPIKLLRLKSR